MCNTKLKYLLKAGILYVFLALPLMLWAAEGDTWIVFDCNRPIPGATERTYWDIWKLDPDGNGSQSTDSLFGVPLTSDPANEWDPTYSAETQSVVFVSDRDGWPHLYKVSIDGGTWQGFFFGNYCTADPCYSFDGAKIAYTSNQNGNWDIYMMDTSGYNRKQITTDLADDRSPCFSADGSMIYFISNRDVPSGGWTQGDWEIYVIDTTGVGTATRAIVNSSGQPLLLDYTEHDPCCSPTNSDIIVFATNKAKPTYTEQVDRINFELWKYSISSHTLTRLTESWDDQPYKELWNSSMPCFSPDGERIAWSADNWTGVGWKGAWEDRPFSTSYWKPADIGQGSIHHLWMRHKDENDHTYWFPPSSWGYTSGIDMYKYQHSKHYNPSWDEQP